jgi:hypothetical protein
MLKIIIIVVQLAIIAALITFMIKINDELDKAEVTITKYEKAIEFIAESYGDLVEACRTNSFIKEIRVIPCEAVSILCFLKIIGLRQFMPLVMKLPRSIILIVKPLAPSSSA